ncbi:hypothetical protein BKA62DRAFT_696062 [Auriculariales sp. MPI-PUGE-AT-0066]|nr:hypothetical protein BKA62DRAFT_696062 [Auriculariales sp. MPI-PUGE-AT-0066]
MQFISFFAVVGAVIASTSVAAMPVANGTDFIWTHDEFLEWIHTTDSELTFIGDPIEASREKRQQSVQVVYRSIRQNNVCGGPCTVYNGGPTCLDAPDTNCLRATANVAFCDRGGCGGSCNQLASCGTRLDNGFCWTSGTASIAVPFV